MKESENKNISINKKAKESGVPFSLMSCSRMLLFLWQSFLVLIGLAHFVGAALEVKADPSDNSYTPRPEWYFLFLFQLFKYFPGELEVIGVVVIPTLVILVLFFLPFLDRSAKRHFLNRPFVTGITVLLSIGIVWLTIQSYIEIPPPVEASSGDQTAMLYVQNCAPCHGPTVSVQPGIDLHQIIAHGSHEGMPAWSADLSTDQIDALVGFILSPGGSSIFSRSCSECHELQDLVESDPIELKNALEQGLTYPPHAEFEATTWPN
jgi:cytochrome c5